MERNAVYVHGIGRDLCLRTKSMVDFLLFSFCLGCVFESNNNEFHYNDGYIVIEWEASAYYLRYLSNREQVIH